MTCDIEKTIKIFNERNKKKQPTTKCDSFLLKPSDEVSCLPHFQLSISLLFMM